MFENFVSLGSADILQCAELLTELHKNGYRIQQTVGSLLFQRKKGRWHAPEKGQKIISETISFDISKIILTSHEITQKAKYVHLSFQIKPISENSKIEDRFESKITFSFCPIRYTELRHWGGDGEDAVVLEIFDPATNTPIAWAMNGSRSGDLRRSEILYIRPKFKQYFDEINHDGAVLLKRVA